MRYYISVKAILIISSTPNDLSYQWINENNEILSNTAFLEASLAGVYTLMLQILKMVVATWIK